MYEKQQSVVNCDYGSPQGIWQCLGYAYLIPRRCPCEFPASSHQTPARKTPFFSPGCQPGMSYVYGIRWQPANTSSAEKKKMNNRMFLNETKQWSFSEFISLSIGSSSIIGWLWGESVIMLQSKLLNGRCYGFHSIDKKTVYDTDITMHTCHPWTHVCRFPFNQLNRRTGMDHVSQVKSFRPLWVDTGRLTPYISGLCCRQRNLPDMIPVWLMTAHIFQLSVFIRCFLGRCVKIYHLILPST